MATTIKIKIDAVGNASAVIKEVSTSVNKLQNQVKATNTELSKTTGQMSAQYSKTAKDVDKLARGAQKAINQFAKGLDAIGFSNLAEDLRGFGDVGISVFTGLTSTVFDLNKSLVGIGKGIKDFLVGALSVLRLAVVSVGRAFLALATNPIVLTITAIVGGLYLLFQAFKEVEERTGALSSIWGTLSSLFSSTGAILAPISSFFSKIADEAKRLSDVIFGRLVSAIATFLNFIISVADKGPLKKLFSKDQLAGLETARKNLDGLKASLAGVDFQISKLGGRKVASILPKIEKEDIKKIQDELKNVGKSQVEITKEVEAQKNLIILAALKQRMISEKEYEDLKVKLSKKSALEITKAQEEELKRRNELEKAKLEELKRRIDEIVKNPFSVLFDLKTQGGSTVGQDIGKIFTSISEGLKNVFKGETLKESLGSAFDALKTGAGEVVTFLTTEGSFSKVYDSIKGGLKDLYSWVVNLSKEEIQKIGVAGTAIAGYAVQGAEGAKKLISSTVKAGLDTIVPGLGEAAGPVLDALMQGPEQVKKMVQEFVKAIPLIIQNIIEALPVLVEELIVGLVDAIIAIADKFDVIAERFLTALIRALPRIIGALIGMLPRLFIALTKLTLKLPMIFINALVKEAPRFVTELIKGLGKGLTGGILGGGKSGGIGGVFKKVGGFLGFAEGGQAFAKSVPSGFSNDTFPARLTSGELVVDRSTAFKLKQFLNQKPEGPRASNSDGILMAILEELRRPQMVQATTTFNQKTLADIMLELSRTNQRVTV